MCYKLQVLTMKNHFIIIKLLTSGLNNGNKECMFFYMRWD